MKKVLFTALCICLMSAAGPAQNRDAASIIKDANNPLATIKAASIHNVYSPAVYGAYGSNNTLWLRYAQPVWRFLIRASLPVNSVNIGNIDKSGLGDLNVFGTFILTQPASKYQFGVGPILTIPTGTSSVLGSGKWQIGAAFAAYFSKSPTLQIGLLATWQFSFAGKSSRNDVHVATIQPFFMWQLGKGLYMRSSAINMLDFENGHYLVPMGLGIGKIVKVNRLVFNLFAEPQFTLWHKGSGLPKTQLFIGINTQF